VRAFAETGQKPLLEDQLGTIIQKMIVAKALAVLLYRMIEAFLDNSNASQSYMERKHIFWISEYFDPSFFCRTKRGL
jgi:hypothetical protein